MKRFLSIFSLSVLLLALFVSAAQAVDTIYTNATVITMNGEQTAEAVAVTGDRIEAVGSAEYIMYLKDSDTEIVDLSGLVLMPGFIDAHSHFLYGGLGAVTTVNLNSPPLGTVTNIDGLVAALETKAQTLTSSDEWVRGSNYDDTLLEEMRHPNREDLDQVSGDHPIYISHISGHVGVANSKALQLAGIDSTTPDPAGGHIVKDPITGEPTGVLEEPAATGLVTAIMPAYTNQEYFAGLAYAMNNYVAAGVTTAQEGAYGNYLLPLFQAGLQMGMLKNRVVILPNGTPAAILGQFAGLKPGDALTEDRMITLGGAKNFSDGSIQAYTGFLSEPYYVQPAGETDYVGYPTLTQQQIIDWVKPLHDAGWQCLIHANGDGAIEYVLNAYEAAQTDNPRPDARHVVVHAQMTRPDQLDRMAGLGVMPTFFVSHTYFWGDRHWNIFMGPERAARMSPCKSALDRNIMITAHNDTPVTPISPLQSVWSAVNRISTGGQLIGADERISVMDALRAVTINSAYQGFEENHKGSIEAGKLADFVVLAQNPLTVDPLAIKDIAVVATIVGNKVVYGNIQGARAASGGDGAGGCFVTSSLAD